MTDHGKAVGNTADGLVVLRAGPHARTIGVHDPFAKWFVSEEGHQLARMAKSVDGVYEEFNLTRYRYTSELLTRHARQYDQMVILGAGFDCRALWLDGLREGRVRVYEVETQTKLDQKREAFRRHGVVLPAWTRQIACDLRSHGVNTLLKDAGLDSQKPMLVLAEGIVFYLPADTTQQILNPNWLGLAKGSMVVFDFWSMGRVTELNRRVSEKIGTPLFQPFPFPTEPDGLRENLSQLGYEQVKVTALNSLAKKYDPHTFKDEIPTSWWIVEAIV